MPTRPSSIIALAPLTLLFILSGCASTNSTETAQSTSAQQEASSADDDAPKPTKEERKQVKSFLKNHIDETSNDSGVYPIPDHPEYTDATGTFAAFHTVHRKKDGTFYVCVDFKAQESDTVYDVDYFVQNSADGMKIKRKFLHKVGDTVVQEK